MLILRVRMFKRGAPLMTRGIAGKILISSLFVRFVGCCLRLLVIGLMLIRRCLGIQVRVLNVVMIVNFVPCRMSRRYRRFHGVRGAVCPRLVVTRLLVIVMLLCRRRTLCRARRPLVLLTIVRLRVNGPPVNGGTRVFIAVSLLLGLLM